MAQHAGEREQELRRGDGRTADRPSDPKAGSWFATLKRTVREFKEDNLTDWAAALTYYGIWRSSRRCWRWCPCSGWWATPPRSR